MCFMRSTIAYLCPNKIMINIYALDFSERRSEEVISCSCCFIDAQCICINHIFARLFLIVSHLQIKILMYELINMCLLTCQ